MATRRLFDEDSHIKEFTAQVISCRPENDRYEIILDATAFFPEGGGQGSDRGFIGSAAVSDVQVQDGIIRHYTDSPLPEGESVICTLDWKRRFRCMQNHSGEHIVSGLVHKLFGFDNVGFALTDSETTMDFSGLLSREELLKIETLANEAVYKNAAFTAVYPSPDKLSRLEYRSKLELYENVRIVTVEGYDVCACCAPHVKSAAEIGLIKLLDFSRLRKGTRVWIKCGTDALADYNEKYRNVREISELLSAKQNEASAAVTRLSEQLGECRHANTQLKKRLIAQLINASSVTGGINARIEDGLDMKEMQLFADGLHRKTGDACAVFSPSGEGFGFAVCGAAEDFFEALKTAFPVRGGGRNGLLQGTVTAPRQALEKFLLENNR